MFGHIIARQMLDEEKLRKAKSSNDVEIAYAARLKTISNPQGPDDNDENSKPAERNAPCFFGSSYVEVTKGNFTQTSEITHEVENTEDLRTVVSKLTQTYNELKTSMDTTIQNAVEDAVTTKLQPIQTEITKMKQTYDQKLEKFIEKTDRQDAKLDKILGILGGNTQAPSEAQRSHGVNK